MIDEFILLSSAMALFWLLAVAIRTLRLLKVIKTGLFQNTGPMQGLQSSMDTLNTTMIASQKLHQREHDNRVALTGNPNV